MSFMLGETCDKLKRQDTDIVDLQRWQQLVARNVRRNHGQATMEEEEGVLMTRPSLMCAEEMIEEEGI